ncbi:TNF receptor-associated factor [Oopsacas minuta]|uniref:TNF receptor-associated factor n=1 Tax=Oopsacas minuta TaxID=111878 RepID=A0AAV7KA55_9METZ|nr:TNF receptor-associated factor [Oopsacas minuta]
MASKDNPPDNSNDLLYVKKVEGKKDMYCGYKRNYLAQNLSEMEEGFIVCKKCTGIMREASFCRGDTTCLIFLRGESEEHCRDLCPMRIISCRYCNKKEKAIDQEKHFDVCSKYPISCPNKCRDKFPRGVLSEHRAKCELEEISCPFSEYGCKAKSMLRRDLLAHKKEYILEHTDMSLIEIKQLKKEKIEMKMEGKIMKQLDGVEWEIKNMNKLLVGIQIEGPEFSLNNYKLRIYCTTVRIFGEENLKFYLKRIAGEFDNILGEDFITHYRVIIVNKQDYTKPYYEEGRMNYQLKIGVSDVMFLESAWEYTHYLTANNSLFIRFYFDVNNSVALKSLTPTIYKGVTSPIPTKMKKDPFY